MNKLQPRLLIVLSLDFSLQRREEYLARCSYNSLIEMAFEGVHLAFRNGYVRMDSCA